MYSGKVLVCMINVLYKLMLIRCVLDRIIYICLYTYAYPIEVLTKQRGNTTHVLSF